MKWNGILIGFKACVVCYAHKSSNLKEPHRLTLNRNLTIEVATNVIIIELPSSINKII